jgi:excisionase family DNA binding protein
MSPPKKGPSMSERLMRVPDGARILETSVPTVYRLIALGQLEAVRVSPRGLRISERALKEFIERQSTRKTEAV